MNRSGAETNHTWNGSGTETNHTWNGSGTETMYILIGKQEQANLIVQLSRFFCLDGAVTP